MSTDICKDDSSTSPKRDEIQGVHGEAAIVGVGIISPIGCDTKSVLDSLRAGRDGIVEATKIDTSKFISRLAGEVGDFDYSSNMSVAELDTYSDPFIRLAVNCARMALKDSEIDLDKYDGRVGLVIATCNGGLSSGEYEYKKKYLDGDIKFDRSLAMQSEYYALSKVLSSALKITGECIFVNTACSGSTGALGVSQSLIESGKCDLVVVGGADALTLGNYAGFNAIKVVSAEKTAPFSTPVGMNIGEGAAFWIIENLDKATVRKSKCYGKIIGSATTADAHHPTQPDPRGDGAYRTMELALKNAGVAKSEIACINAHGSATEANDKAESKAIVKFRGEFDIPVTSTKSYTGHCMGATGIIEATCQLLSMNDNYIPATLRNRGRRPNCEIEAVAEGIEKSYDCFMSANYAFAGSNAAIVVAKQNFKSGKKNVDYSARIAITGLSAVSSLGLDMDEQIAKLNEGQIGIANVERFETERKAGSINLPNLRTLDRRMDFSGMSDISVYASLVGKRSLDDAGIVMTRNNESDVGMTVAVSKGCDTSKHMDAVFKDFACKGDITCFSNLTANSTAGWVSKSLQVKGANTTLTTGMNCGLQTIEHMCDLLKEGRVLHGMAIAADEISRAQLNAYETIENLWSGAEEDDFKLRSESDFKTVMGEGAAAFVLEKMDAAISRGAKIYGEILGCASTMDIDDFLAANMASDGLQRAIDKAFERSGLAESDIDLIVWTPRGCRQDDKILELCRARFPNVCMLTSVFNTGYIETASSLETLAFALKSLKENKKLWKQKTGDLKIDSQNMNINPKNILCIASSHTANNHALIVGR